MRRALLWGIAAQGSSSATNLALSVFAGRALGPSGLGVVFIGFAALQVVQALARSVLVQPLVAHAATRPAPQRERLAGVGVTLVALVGVGATAAFAAVAVLAGDSSLRDAFLLFAPWLVPSLLHELWKAMLFQEGNGGRAAASDGARLIVMLVFAPLVHDSASHIVAVWGLASTFGLAFAAVSFPLRPQEPRAAALAWRDAGWALGRWLGGREAAFQASAYATTLALAAFLGTSAVGGLRSAEVLFSPFSFVAAALALPALPAVARAAEDSPRYARRLALALSGAATALGAAYFVVMALSRSWLLPHVFGREFEAFESLIWPLGAAQLFHSVGFGFVLLLVASKRGVAAFVNGLAWGIANLVLVVGLAISHGIDGAAWGIAIAAAVAATAAVFVALQNDAKSARGRPL